MSRAVLIVCLGLALLVVGCDQASVSDKPAAAPSTKLQTFQVKGLVLEVKPEEKMVKIKHEKVPGYMDAMTMPFEVRDTNELAGLEAGDPVSFRLLVTETDGWIDHIVKTGPKSNTLPTSGPIRFARPVDEVNEGDRFPEYQFTNQLGQAFSTRQFQGKALAINFIFTRCPFPLYCPQTVKFFGETQQKLLAMPAGPTNWQFLTISFDPDFDTPAVLKAYAEAYKSDPRTWTFATGSLLEVTTICDQFGLAFWRDETGSITHKLRTVVVDANGRVQRIIVGNEWKPDELTAEMVKAAGAK
jgi:protein SCO1/2